VKILKLLALVAVLGCSASVALADGGGITDPTVTVNKKGDPSCPASAGADYVCFSANTQQDPLTVPTGTGVNYVWSGLGGVLGVNEDSNGALDELWVEVLPTAPGEVYSCIHGDIFGACAGPVGSADAGGAEFVFYNGELFAGTEVSVTAPEPKSLLMLMAGLLPLFAFRKRIASRLSL
jgi:hypothetical protein